MIPRVRLKYVQGLATAHEELRLPRPVDLTTDGANVIVSSAGSGRPLLTVPLTAVEKTELVPDCGPATATNRSAAGLAGGEHVIVLQVRNGPGVPAAVAQEPIVFSDPHDEEVTPRYKTLRDVLVPRTDEEMSKLRKGESRVARTYAIAFAIIVAVLLLIGIAIQQLIAGPKPRDASVPARVVLASLSVVANGSTD